jgi:hypothetical protein
MLKGFHKIGESFEISRIETFESCLPSVSAEVLEQFKKTAHSLKKVAPKAEDFLYFSAVMMHSAEASALHDDGTHKLNAHGEEVKVGWDKSEGTWRWMTNDPSIKPYKNSNGDIFPEEELVKAYSKWRGKPLCIDHKSSSVDHVRGFIVDTYYDRALKRVIALCALDKAGYPQLARQVSTGVSTNVSMGTAVGKAICSDCARVAKTEADFCDHMRRKSCYGEINVDLNPIELSIVVTGADPKASIKHIIAAANTLNAYVETKAKELKKVADNFKANINFTKGNPTDYGSDPKDAGTVTNVEITSKDLDSFKQDVNKAIEDFEKLQSSLNAEEENLHNHGNDLASSSDSTDTDAMGVSGLDDNGLAPPHARFASEDVEVDSIAELRKVTASIATQLDQMKECFNKLEKTSTKIQEENMSGSKEINKKGYYQGTEEPTPGQTKYPADPLNSKLRTDGDKHMDGETPFPDTGSVDQLYPGDLERKKLLARATAEERALKRQAIVSLAQEAVANKTAYIQNGEGPNNPNTPTPGKVKYPADKLNEQLRDNGDKHMTGQKPFPGVGAVDGLHPSPSSADVADEKKRKELLSRASHRARFVKAVNEQGAFDMAKSSWEVFYGDKLLVTATVDELSGGNDMNYDQIPTKAYGAKLIEKVKAFGSDGVKDLIKKAQQDPGAPMPAPEPMVAPMPDAAPGGEDTGEAGDPKQAALKLAEKVRDLSSDLAEAVRALTGEQAEMGEAGPEGMAASASFGDVAMTSVKKDLNSALTKAMKESLAELEHHTQELELISNMNVNPVNEDLFNSLVDDAITETKQSFADGFSLMTAFVKYARAGEAIEKRAQAQAELDNMSADDLDSDSDDNDGDDDLMALINDASTDLGDVKDLMSDDDGDEDDVSLEGLTNELHGENDMTLPLDEEDADVSVKQDELKDLGKLPSGSVVTVTAGFDSKASRAALRAKLAADTVKFSPILHDAHPKGGETTDLDVKPQGNLAEVEDLEGVHDAMMDLAQAPPKVRKEAEAINQLISQGKLHASDLDALVAEGLDKEAVNYWRKYYAQADGGSEFASELVKEHVKAEIEAELNVFKVKMARAFELAYDMVDRGLLSQEKSTISDQVDKIMKFDDNNFETLKSVVAKHAPVMKKSAGRLPVVGLLGADDNVRSQEADDFSQLSSLFATNSKRGSF